MTSGGGRSPGSVTRRVRHSSCSAAPVTSSAAHDLSEGGLAQTLVEMCLVGEVGARIVLPESADPFVYLFSESAARAVVAVPRTEELRFSEMCQARHQPWTRIGVVDAVDPDGHHLDIQGVARLALPDLRAAWEGSLPALFGPGVAG